MRSSRGSPAADATSAAQRWQNGTPPRLKTLQDELFTVLGNRLATGHAGFAYWCCVQGRLAWQAAAAAEGAGYGANPLWPAQC
jgi:hypothetical protein